MKIRIIASAAALLAALFICPDALSADNPDGKPKNIILFIGDGMSVPQREAAEEYSKATRARGLYLNEMPFSSATVTRSANNTVTDSAASGTAIACGVKTNNGRIGVDPNGNELESAASVAKKTGRKVGIVTSVTINHATPASFYGHRAARSDYYGLGLDLIASGFDFFGGGGIADNDRKNHAEYKGDIYALAADSGYKVVRKDKAAFSALAPIDGKVIATGSDGALDEALDLEENDITLADFTAKAIEMLENPAGFFLMVEGGRVDWAGHANDPGLLFAEILELDKAVKTAVDFAARDSNTLIVATGDHETGGLTIGLAGTGGKLNYLVITNQTASLNAVTEKAAAMIKSDDDVSMDAVYPVLNEMLGLKESGDSSDPMVLTDAEKQQLAESLERQKTKKKGMSIGTQAGHILAGKAGISFNSFGHTALPVRTSACGKCASAFTNAVDNTSISIIMKDLLSE